MKATVVVSLLNLVKQSIPYFFNDKEETKFNPNTLLKLVTLAILIYILGPEATEFIVELAKELG